MVREIGPFGNYNDPEIERALDWLLGFLDKEEWDDRVANIGSQIDAVMAPAVSIAEADPHQHLSMPTDRIGWYLYLADTALHEPFKYEPTQGSRVLPMLKRIGADLDRLLQIKGVEARVRRMLGEGRAQPDSALFEILVALVWHRNGWQDIEFIDESPEEKRPDLRARRGMDEWFIECKRLQKSSAYSEQERDHWLRMWAQLRQWLVREEYSAVFDIVFHVEIVSLPEDFLVNELRGKLPLVQLPCVISSNETWTVSAHPIDYASAREHLRKYSVRYPSDQLSELIGGRRDPNRGFTSAVMGRFRSLGEGAGAGRFLDELGFAVGAFWSCDAERAIERKARDVRGRLADAVNQLPTSGKCAVHIALETLDGMFVEAERYRRIVDSIFQFDPFGKDLRWVFCHLFQSYAPPDDCWVIDETVYYFGASLANNPSPLESLSAVVPEEANTPNGVHWLRPPP